jgi:hypothetical protein
MAKQTKSQAPRRVEAPRRVGALGRAGFGSAKRSRVAEVDEQDDILGYDGVSA